jgi:hypothetical protein
VLAAGGGREEARGGEVIARLATAIWHRERTYLAEPRRVIQARDTALWWPSVESTWYAAAATGPGGTRSRSCPSKTRPRRRSNDAGTHCGPQGRGRSTVVVQRPGRDQGDGRRHGGQLTIVEVTEPPAPRRPFTSITARTRPSGSSRARSLSRSATPSSRRARATTPSGHATSRSATPAAECSSSASPAASRIW